MEESSEDESVGASSAANHTEEESGGSSSENESERAGSKRLKLSLKEDRISALSDSLIHRILSFMPSTKEAIQTGILSKRWQNQWNRVPVLIFDSAGKSDKNFSQFIDRTLTMHDCPKLKKFHIRYDYNLQCDPQLTSKIRFATRKDVEELILYLDPLYMDNREVVYTLPKFLFNNASLVKLELFRCNLRDFPIPNWPCLKELKLDCFKLRSPGIQHVVSGSPLLESLELIECNGYYNDVIASKSLKRLIFIDAGCYSNGEEYIRLSCPNLEVLIIKVTEDPCQNFPAFPHQTIENVLSGSPLLHTLELLESSCFDRHIIASKSLKRLVLGEINGSSDIVEISCPDLQEVNLYHFVPYHFPDIDLESISRLEPLLVIKVLGQLQHVKQLEIGSELIKILSALKVERLSSPLLNCKCLTLDGTNFDKYITGILCAINSSPALEKLVIKVQPYQYLDVSLLKNCRKNNFWDSNRIVFNCSVSNLKTIKIVGLSERNEEHKLVLHFVEFVLKNARMLDKIIVILAKCGKCFLFEVSKKLLSFPRCSPHTIIELLSSN